MELQDLRFKSSLQQPLKKIRIPAKKNDDDSLENSTDQYVHQLEVVTGNSSNIPQAWHLMTLCLKVGRQCMFCI